jgi:hypothetical protein
VLEVVPEPAVLPVPEVVVGSLVAPVVWAVTRPVSATELVLVKLSNPTEALTHTAINKCFFFIVLRLS